MLLLFCVIPLLIMSIMMFWRHYNNKKTEFGYFVSEKSSGIIGCLGLILSVIGYCGILYFSGKIYESGLLLLKVLYCLGCVISWHSALIMTAETVYGCYCCQKSIVPEIHFFPDITVSSDEIKKNFKEKNKDTRKYIQRVICLAVPTAAFLFMFAILGTSESFFANLNEWDFLFKDYFVPAVIFSLFVLLIFSFVISLKVKGSNLDRLAVFISSITVISYIQYMFLNTDTLLKGQTTDIFDNFTRCFGNLFLWTEVIAVSQFLYSQFKTKIRNILLYACAFIMLIQLPSVIYLINKAPASAFYYTEEKKYDIDPTDQFELSANENIVVFIMDAYYEGYFETLLSEEPDYYKTFSDFTFYNNVNSCSNETAFSIPYILTSTDFDYSIDLESSNHNAWNSMAATEFYDSMHKDGYIVKLYTDSADYCGGAENMKGKIDNISEFSVSYKSNKPMVFFEMLKLSAYKYVPDAFKPFFMVYDSRNVNKYVAVTSSQHEFSQSDDWRDTTQTSLERGIYFNNFDYYNGLKTKRLTTRNDKKVCVFQHINGMHKAFQGLTSDKINVTQEEAQKACLTIFSEYLSQMKELGIYDNSCIILTADHGFNTFEHNNSIFLIKEKNEHKDLLTVNSAPGDIQEDFLATVAKAADIKCSGLGTPITELDENMIRVRKRRFFMIDYDYPPAYKCNGVGNAAFNIYREYTFTGKELSNDDEYKTSQLIDYWW